MADDFDGEEKTRPMAPAEHEALRMRHDDDHDVAWLTAKAHRMDASFRMAKWLLTPVLAVLLGGFGYVLTKMWTGGFEAGELEIRVQHLERDVQRLTIQHHGESR